MKSSAKVKITGTVIAIFFTASFNTKAQIPINLQTAVDTALKNNLTIKNERLKAEYQKKIIKTSANIPQTSILGEYGQINSYYSDNRFGVTQSFEFPKVYASQKKLLNEAWNTSVLTILLKEAEIKKIVYDVFYTFLFLKEKEKLLLKNDSMYSIFLDKTILRLAKGESNLLEKTTSESQRGAIAIQLKQVQQDIEIVKLQFTLILNTSTNYVPSEESLILILQVNDSNSNLEQHPLLKIIEQQKKMSLLSGKVEKAKLLPEFNIGYYNMTMKGIGADDKLYTSSNRFQSVQFGLGIPLFFGAKRAKVTASRINQSITQNLYQYEKKQFDNQLQTLLIKHQANKITINYFESVALKNATIIFETSNKQFINGDISYLDWVMLTNQAINIQSGYLDAVKNLNETIIQINYLLTK